MKTQLQSITQALSGISNFKNMLAVMAAGLTGPQWKVPFNKAGQYILPLLKQILRDSFMGSETEMRILLLFMQSYFLSAIYIIRHNRVIDQFKKIGLSKNERVLPLRNNFYHHKQAA